MRILKNTAWQVADSERQLQMRDYLVSKLERLVFSIKCCSRHKEELSVLSVLQLLQKDRKYSILPKQELALTQKKKKKNL